MTLETCIAHAISSELDVLEAFPELEDLPIEQLETTVERHVRVVQDALYQVISERGDRYLRAKDAAGLCATCISAGIVIPPSMLLRMCQTIVQLTTVDARFILDTEDGKSLFYVKMALA